MKSAWKDNTTLTGASIIKNPRNLAVVVVLYTLLAMFRVFLISVIKINSATVMSFRVHCWAMTLLYQTRALLNFKDR